LLIIAQLEQPVPFAANHKMPLPRLQPLLLYPVYLKLSVLPDKRPRALGIFMPGVAFDLDWLWIAWTHFYMFFIWFLIFSLTIKLVKDGKAFVPE
jgi:hypothetical protein